MEATPALLERNEQVVPECLLKETDGNGVVQNA